MRELLETIIKGIVNNPDEVTVEMRDSVDFPGLKILSVEVAGEDKGIVIGRKGRTINAIRDIVKIAAIRTGDRVRVIVEDGGPREDDFNRSEASGEEMSDNGNVADEASAVQDSVPTIDDAEVEDVLSDEI